MSPPIGIRREDKSKWERRVPLIPADLAALRAAHGLQFLIQPSPIRAYTDEEYLGAGAGVSEDLGPASIVLAVKEIPETLLEPGKTYVYFAHVIKGQAYNMPMLRRLLDLGCSLVDYEKIADDQNRRLIFFGRHAGCAGMIETLWGLGQRLAAEGVDTPLARVRHAYEYDDLAAAKSHLRELGEEIARDGLPAAISPLVIGFAGYGNVSEGAQEVLDSLPVGDISVQGLPLAAAGKARKHIIKVVFKEEHMVEPVDPGGRFDLLDYYENPANYRGRFEEHLPHLDVLVNAIYWDERYPRLVTKEWTRSQYGQDAPPRLKVIGDISCDIEGSVELTLKVTQPDSPCFVYDPEKDAVHDGVSGRGPAIMAVDNLPCELPIEASQTFSSKLREMIPDLVAADWNVDFEQLNLPDYLKKAVITHKGRLTPAYEHLRAHLGG
jgi:alpha-aminoadipic semialdehyde synthase